jgi:hypothetical protein
MVLDAYFPPRDRVLLAPPATSLWGYLDMGIVRTGGRTPPPIIEGEGRAATGLSETASSLN